MAKSVKPDSETRGRGRKRVRTASEQAAYSRFVGRVKDEFPHLKFEGIGGGNWGGLGAGLRNWRRLRNPRCG